MRFYCTRDVAEKYIPKKMEHRVPPRKHRETPRISLLSVELEDFLCVALCNFSS